jgi:hypothetical protein
MKQKTIEEAAKDTTNKYINEREKQTAYLEFIEGAKSQSETIGLMEIELNHTKTLLASCEKALEERDLQAERMYSEEEVIELIKKAVYQKQNAWKVGELDKWFEQFKKKQNEKDFN